MIDHYIVGGIVIPPDQFDAWAAAHPEAFEPPKPPAPTLEQVKAQKIAEFQAQAATEAAAGVLTTPGLRMRYGQEDCVLVDGIVRYTELKGLPVVPKLIEADGTIHTNVTLADGQTIRLEQFEAVYAADERFRALAAQVQAATSVAEVEAITW
jgi:hypothetical protein